MRGLRPDSVHNRRILLFYAQRGRCAYCQRRISLREATLDHVKPRSRGGSNAVKNLVCACLTCNWLKGDQLRHPRLKPDKRIVETCVGICA